MLMELSDYGENLSHLTLKHEIENVYSDLDNEGYKSDGNIMVDRKARVSRISLINSVIGFGHNTDLVKITKWHEIVPWLNTGAERTSCNPRNLKRFSARRRDGPIDEDYTLIADRYKRRPVYHGSGLPLDGEIVPFCPAWIHAEQAEFEFKSEHCALTSDSQGNVGGCKGGVCTLDDVDMVLNDVFVETSPEFEKKKPGRSMAIGVPLVVASVIFPVGAIGVFGVGLAAYFFGKAAKHGVNYNKNKIQFSVGEFNVSFCGHASRRPLQLTG